MNSEICGKVAREFAAKRTRAILEAQAHKKRVYAACPALGKIDREMARLAHEQFLSHMENGKDNGAEQKIKALCREKEKLLADMGAGDLSPKFSCPICKDTGRVADGYCKCFLNRVIEENLAAANLAADAKEETFDRFDLSYYSKEVDEQYGVSPYQHMKKIRNVCKRFAEEIDLPHKNILLMGAPGLGKTFLSGAIAHRVLEKGFTVVYISAGEFAARAGGNKFGENPKSMQAYYDADLLILDDLGTEFKTGLTVSTFGDVLDRRLRAGKKMVFSTNLSLSELEKFYNVRITSRLVGGFGILKCIGEDIRRLKG